MSENHDSELQARLDAPTLAPEPAAEPAGSHPSLAPTEPSQAGPAPEAPGPASGPPNGMKEFPLPGWDKYRAQRLLGKGGMGEVWLATKLDLNLEVALKLVPTDDPERVKAIIDEGQALARVKHDRVCKVHEVGHERGYAFIAMQHVDGETLGAMGPRLTVEQLAVIVRDIALGVHATHAVAVIHRDIKPSNIMVERSAEGLKSFLVDFGVARPRNASEDARQVIGTPAYMSPEQASGEVASLDRRADVYGLGATLYHLLTGRPPFDGAGILEILHRVRIQKPAPPRALKPTIPEDLSAIVLQCLEKDRSARYDSARALAEDLDRYLNGDPVQARAGAAYRLYRRLRKNSRFVYLGVAAVAALGWAIFNRFDAAERERLARDFTERVEGFERVARESALSPPHDLRKERAALRADMDKLRAEIRSNGDRAQGPGQYALGKGFLALGEYEQARTALESAWANGFRQPRVAYALGIVLGHEYLEKLTEAQRNQESVRKVAVEAVQRRYQQPVLDYLKLSQGLNGPSEEYLAALLAFYEQRYDDSLRQLDDIHDPPASAYELLQLRGDILRARAFSRWERGDHAGQQADFDGALGAYQQAANIARSMPSLHAAQAQLHLFAVIAGLLGGGEVESQCAKGLKALEPIDALVPDDSERLVLQAELNRNFAEYRRTNGGDVDGPLERALQAALRAARSAPASTVARAELAQVYRQRATYWVAQSKDPREDLRLAVDLLQGVDDAERDPDFYLNLGLVFSTWADAEDRRNLDSAEHRGKAIEAFLSASRLDERYPRAWSNLGTNYFLRATAPRAADADGDLTLAKASLEKALASNPRSLPSYYYLGLVAQQRAERAQTHGVDPRPVLEEALKQLQMGRELNPRYLPILNGIGTGQQDLAQADWDWGRDPFPALDEAGEAFKAALAIDPDQSAAATNLAETTERQAEYRAWLGEDPTALTTRALQQFRGAEALAEENPTPLTGRGLALMIQARYELQQGRDPRGRLAEARAAAKAASNRQEMDEDTFRVLGGAQGVEVQWNASRGIHEPGGYERAAELYENGLKAVPGYWFLLREYALVCFDWAEQSPGSGGDPGAALERVRRLTLRMLEVRPQLPEAKAFRAWARALEAERAPPADRRELRRRALEDLDAALKANPNLAFAWRARRDALERRLAE